MLVLPAFPTVTTPKDAMVDIPIFNLHRNGDVCHNPLAFDPTRFARGERQGAGPLVLTFGGGAQIDSFGIGHDGGGNSKCL